MSASELLTELRERGVELAAVGGGLRYRPKAAVTDELLERIRGNKPRLLKLLEWERRKLKEADRRSLVIRPSKEPGWIALRDPTTGDWHEVRESECLPGVVQTANRYRKKGGAA